MVPYWLGGYYYLRFFVKKNSDDQVANYLPRAHLLNIVSIILQCTWGIAGGYIFYSHPIIPQSMFVGNSKDTSETWAIVSAVFSAVVWIALNHYWLIVTRRYAAKEQVAYAEVVQNAAGNQN